MPQPPALDLTPQSARAVVTVAVGSVGRELLAASGDHMRAYAKRLGADFYISTWEGHPAWPMSAKFGIARVLDHYERIAYLDADTLCRPGCVSLFDACHPEEFGAVDELANHRCHPEHGREAGYVRFRAAMGFPAIPLPWYWNAGVMIVPNTARGLLLPPTVPIQATHCGEQDHSNCRVLASGHPCRLIDRRCNWMFWVDPGFRAAPSDAVLHFAGCGPSGRADQIRQWAERHPV